MYCNYFSLAEPPFSIVPDPRFLFMSDRHQEALAHLLYGVQGQGGFILVTGEVGTGKTTVCKGFLSQLPENTDVAWIINPKLSVLELLDTLCDELGITRETSRSVKHYIDVINQYLLKAHAAGRHTVLMIDEAQNLSGSVLEQIRLLTNLETNDKKLLQIILIGQPELTVLLQNRSLRQLTQRITARYHLEGLNREETESYVRFRLSVAGSNQQIFSRSALNVIYKATGGIPRLINLVCDRCLLAAYGEDADQVSRSMAIRSVKEALFPITGKTPGKAGVYTFTALGVVVALLLLAILYFIPVPRNFLMEAESGVETETLSGFVSAIASKNTAAAPDNTTTAPKNKNTELKDETRSPTAGSPESPLNLHESIAGEQPVRPMLSPDVQASLTWSKTVVDEQKAYGYLGSMWGVEGMFKDKSALCSSIESKGLKCESRQGSWQAFIDVNRPGLFKVFNPDLKEKGYLIIKRVNGSDLLVLADTPQGEKWLTRSDMESWWRGDFVYLWMLPPYKAALIRPGQPGKKSDWLAGSLSQIKKKWKQAGDAVFADYRLRTGDTVDTESANPAGHDITAIIRFYDSPDELDMEQQVRLFQAATGLADDGIAGEMTQIRINGELDDTIPLLYPSISRWLVAQEQ
ncbi:MAG: hypothetical protein CSB48_11560 [Proteobacteria bacterium]|nr:MAG: hypothetical protein CSB48_11560 [Pseudomonadota bacterium]PIE40110.1 MAG: hypothetical protein CSA51_02415 [Gammaproteobacteria bacterium]